MPAALWLTPTPGPFLTLLTELLHETVPSNFPVSIQKSLPKFTPHITLTSDILASTYGSDPQAWLDKLDLPEFVREKNEVNVELDEVVAGGEYFKKLFIRARQEGNLSLLAARCRREAVIAPGHAGEPNSHAANGDTLETAEKSSQEWVEQGYDPHLSLLYGDLSEKEVRAKVSLVELQVGFAFGSLFDCCGGTLSMGGEILLVDTDTGKDVAGWKVLGRREARWGRWVMTRNLM